MIVIAPLPKLFGFDAITFWPFVFIDKHYAKNEPLIKHEMVHYREQRKVLTLPWLFWYWVNRQFRFEAEIRGHAVQVQLGGGTIQWAAWHISSKYKTGHSLEQCLEALQKELTQL
jgi:hypothetical protein